MSHGSPVRTGPVADLARANSKASTNPGANFIPFGPEELESLAPVLKSFRATLAAESCTASASHQAAWQTSEDGVNWGDGTVNNHSIAECKDCSDVLRPDDFAQVASWV